LATELDAAGRRLCALDTTEDARSLFSIGQAWPQDAGTLVLLLGNERAGVDPALLALARDIYFLPMLGGKRSINVAVAFGIAAYTLMFSRNVETMPGKS
jgi:tRNA G18 (ribose-2'-O)-methylase SpoU